MVSSFFALFDDIASLLDDVATMTKLAAKKTAGVLGDDLALNAQQVSGVRAQRELPVVLAVARGSLVNKAILVPAALAISALAPWAVAPLLMLGGTYLCFEGFEKLAHRFFDKGGEDSHHDALARALSDPNTDVLALERTKIRGAVRTDFILSAEIVVIALGSLAEMGFWPRVLALAAVAVLITVLVYGAVAAIVKLDDLGLWMLARARGPGRWLGQGLVSAAPWLMKALSVAGTVAMFLVGGSILLHGAAPLAHAVDALLEPLAGWAATLAGLGLHAATGVAVGAATVGLYAVSRRLAGR